MARKTELRERIVDAALDLAEEVGWDAVRLRAVAGRLGVPLAALRAEFRDADAVANAWFGRAGAAMLAPQPKRSAALPASERVHRVMMRWFDALAPHRAVSGQMLSAKVYLPHPHHWAPLIFDVSRTVQWIREAAILDAVGRRKTGRGDRPHPPLPRRAQALARRQIARPGRNTRLPRPPPRAGRRPDGAALAADDELEFLSRRLNDSRLTWVSGRY